LQKAKIFNINWHPNFSYILASSSDDKSIVIYDLRNKINK